MTYHGINLPGKEEITTPGRKIYAGLNANVYEWGEDKVIKLFSDSYPTDWITREYYNALAVRRLNFPKVKVVELKKTEFGFGIVFEKVQGELLLDYIERTGDLKTAADYMVELQRKIHENKFDPEQTESLETAHEQLRREMLLTPKADSDATKEMLRFLGTMKDGNMLCHGNLHPDNILITENGPLALSCKNYCIGMELFDVARTFFLIGYSSLPGEEGGCTCQVPGCRGVSDMEKRKELGRYYLDGMGHSATEIGGYLSMIIAGM